MKTSILLICLLTTSVFCQPADITLSDYKQRIEWTLAKEHPEYRAFYCEYYGPAQATVGEQKKVVYAVCCDWGGRLKNGAVPLMVTRQIFVFDASRLSQAAERDIHWVRDNPIPEKKRSNKPATGQRP